MEIRTCELAKKTAKKTRTVNGDIEAISYRRFELNRRMQSKSWEQVREDKQMVHQSECACW